MSPSVRAWNVSIKKIEPHSDITETQADELSGECNAGKKLIVLRNCNGSNDWSIII